VPAAQVFFFFFGGTRDPPAATDVRRRDDDRLERRPCAGASRTAACLSRGAIAAPLPRGLPTGRRRSLVDVVGEPEQGGDSALGRRAMAGAGIKTLRGGPFADVFFFFFFFFWAYTPRRAGEKRNNTTSCLFHKAGLALRRDIRSEREDQGAEKCSGRDERVDP
jgi:hypothetical protein